LSVVHGVAWHRILAFGVAIVAGSAASSASAQNCFPFPFPFGCQGSGRSDGWGGGDGGRGGDWGYPRRPQRAPVEITPDDEPYEQPAPRRAPMRPEVAAPAAPPLDSRSLGQYGALYAAVGGEAFPIPAVRLSDIDPVFLRKAVIYPTNEPPGTIVIDPQNHFLYLVQGNGRALRYGVGVGRQGFGWSGTATIHDKQEWPDWYPPREMLARQPELARRMSELRSGIGMPGGPGNPLGARALYLWQGNKDTLYRIHGTVEPWTIGKSVSSGCIRMINQDVMDLYERTPVGATVVVLSARYR
jgi:lipoprotein-anchoring transpeptidase ErfK/SrfK